jgi:hypothetical protein
MIWSYAWCWNSSSSCNNVCWHSHGCLRFMWCIYPKKRKCLEVFLMKECLFYLRLWLTLCSRSFSRRNNSSILAFKIRRHFLKRILVKKYKCTLASSSRFLRLSSTCDRWSLSRLRNCNHFFTLSICCCCL